MSTKLLTVIALFFLPFIFTNRHIVQVNREGTVTVVKSYNPALKTDGLLDTLVAIKSKINFTESETKIKLRKLKEQQRVLLKISSGNK